MTDFVVFYSLTGRSRNTAQRLADATGAELVEIVETQPKTPGFMGYMSAMLDSFGRRTPKIRSTPQVGAGDRVILCGPIWVGRIAGPLRSWLAEHGREAGHLVWVSLSGAGREWSKATAEIAALTGHRPEHVAAIAEREVDKGEVESKISELAGWLKTPA